MQESKKKKIVVASVLKPVDDSRMFEKIGFTFFQAGYDVHIFGTGEKDNSSSIPNLHYHAHQLSKRLSTKRWLMPLILFRKLWKVKPTILVVCSHELLLMAGVFKLFHPTKIVYDIRENYVLNIQLHTKIPNILKSFLSFYLLQKQKLATYWIDVFWLAETCYQKQLSFLPEKFVHVFENRVSKKHLLTNSKAGYKKIIFTGTLAESTGVIKFIEFAEKLIQAEVSLQFTIAGHSYDNQFINKIKSLIRHVPQIELIGGNEYVSHSKILKLISEANFGFIYYPNHKATSNKMATKLFEYAGAGLPIITPGTSEYANWVIQEQTGLVWNESEKPEETLKRLIHFTKRPDTSATWYWESLESELLKSISI